jgi:tetratricopeptide (TPR) repeat protein
MSAQITARLRGQLTGAERKHLAKRDTDDPEAYQLYLKGRYFWEKRAEEPLRKSIEYFSQAIERDPGYARAYSGLADAYAVSPSYGFLSPREAVPKSRAAAEKALELDGNLARGHAVSGFNLWYYDWNYPAAEAELKKALSLDPRDSTTLHWYGLLLISLGRTDEAVTQLQRAHEIAPFQGIIRANIVRAHFCARQYDRVIDDGRGEEDRFFLSHTFRGYTYLAKGAPRQAAVEFQRAADLVGRNPQGLTFAGLAEAVSGRRAEARKVIDEMQALAAQRYIEPIFVAWVYVGLAEKDHVFEWLEKAYADHSWSLVFLKVDPRWDPIRSDPRFADLLRRINLAP